MGVARAAVDPHDRAAVLEAYVHEWHDALDVPTGSTGSVAGCVVGGESDASVAATASATNFARALAGLPPVRFEPSWQPDALAAALMMSAAGDLEHAPPPSWPCYTDAGLRGASSSNLALGATGAQAIELYLHDEGVPSLGHRLWILDPFALAFATGSTANANALTVTRGRSPSARNASALIAWPPAGYVPVGLIPRRWSLRLVQDGASFETAAATVSVAAGGVPLAVTGVAAGGDTLAWDVALPASASDVPFDVTVGGVTRDGAPFALAYRVTAVGLEAPGEPVDVTAALDIATGLVHVAFAPGALRGVPITGYRVALVTAQDDVVAAADLPPTATGAVLRYALPPDTPAAVAVRASSRLGWSAEARAVVSGPWAPVPVPPVSPQPPAPSPGLPVLPGLPGLPAPPPGPAAPGPAAAALRPALPVVRTRQARLVRGGVELAVRCPAVAAAGCAGTLEVHRGRTVLGARGLAARPGATLVARLALRPRATRQAADGRGRVQTTVVVRGVAGRRATALTVLGVVPPRRSS